MWSRVEALYSVVESSTAMVYSVVESSRVYKSNGGKQKSRVESSRASVECSRAMADCSSARYSQVDPW